MSSHASALAVALLVATAGGVAQAASYHWQAPPRREDCSREGFRKYSAIIRGTGHKGDWKVPCLRELLTVNGKSVKAHRCDVSLIGEHWGVFDVADATCASKGRQKAVYRWQSPYRRETCNGLGLRQYAALLRGENHVGDWKVPCLNTLLNVEGKSVKAQRCDQHPDGHWGVFQVPDTSCSIDGRVATYADAFVARVAWGETEKKGISTDKNKVAELTWGRVIKDLRKDLNDQGFRAGSADENTLKAKVLANAKVQKKLDEHVAYWKKNPEGFLGQVRDGLKEVGCAIAAPICMIVDIVKGIGGFIAKMTKYKGDLGKVLEEYMREFKEAIDREVRFAQSQLSKAFEAFREVLSGKIDVGGFAKQILMSVQQLTERFHKNLGIPDLSGKPLSWVVGATTAGAITAATAPMVLIHKGVSAILKWLIPELIFGAGKAFNAAGGGKEAPPDGVFTFFLDALKLVVGAVGGGALKVAFDNPSIRERVQGIVRNVVNISGKIQKVTDSALRVVEAARTGNLESLEKALESSPATPSAISPDEMKKVIEGLGTFAEEQIWGALNPPLRKVLSKALNLLDRVLDVPRNAMVSAVGSVPFVGGILAGALNFGIGIVVGLIKDFLEDQVLELAHGILKDVMQDLNGAMLARLQKPNGAQDAKGFMSLLQVVGQVAGELKGTLEAATEGARGSLLAMAGNAVSELILRGIADPNLRTLVGSALKVAIDKVGAKSLNLGALASDVLRAIAEPASRMVASAVGEPLVADAVARAVKAALEAAANPAGARAMLADKLGLLGGLAQKALQGVRGALTGALKSGGTSASALLQKFVEQQGFAALLSSATWQAVLAAGKSAVGAAAGAR